MKPSNVLTGRVVGRVIMGVQDGPDPDDEPDYIAAKGTADLVMSVPYIPNPTADPVPVTMLNARRRLVLDAEGYWCTALEDGSPGARGMRLEADGSPDALVSGWTWTITYRFEPVNGSSPSIPAHSFVMLPGAVEDLTKMVKVPSSPGVGLPQAEAAVLRAEAAAVESAESAAAAEAASGTILEMTETGRLSEDALIATIGELSGPVIEEKTAPFLDIATDAKAAAQDVVARADRGDFKGDPGNATVRVDNTVGKRVFISDGTTEHMISGDTGWRNISSSLVNGWAGRLLARRLNDVVELRFSEVDSKNSTSPTIVDALPLIFRAYQSGIVGSVALSPDGSSVSGGILVSSGSQNQVWRFPQAGAIGQAAASAIFTTNYSWTGPLPGVTA